MSKYIEIPIISKIIIENEVKIHLIIGQLKLILHCLNVLINRPKICVKNENADKYKSCLISLASIQFIRILIKGNTNIGKKNKERVMSNIMVKSASFVLLIGSCRISKINTIIQ